MPLYFLYGLTLAGIGAAWPRTREIVGASPGILGALLLAYSLARGVGAIVFARYLRTAHPSRALVLALQGIAGAALAFGYAATSALELVLVLLLYGYAMGILDLLATSFALLRDNLRLLFVNNAAFSVGTIASPLLIYVELDRRWTWHYGEVVPYLLSGAILVALVTIVPKDFVVSWSNSREAERGPRRKRPTMMVLLAVVAGSETAIGAWTATYVSAGRSGSVDGLVAASGYWLGFALTRFIGSDIARRASWAGMAIASAFLAGTLVVAATSISSPVTVAAFLVAGAILGPAYPLLVSRQATGGAPARVADAIVVSTLGSAAIPAIAGLLWGIDRAAALIVCGAAPAATMLFGWSWLKREGKGADESDTSSTATHSTDE